MSRIHVHELASRYSHNFQLFLGLLQNSHWDVSITWMATNHTTTQHISTFQYDHGRDGQVDNMDNMIVNS